MREKVSRALTTVMTKSQFDLRRVESRSSGSTHGYLQESDEIVSAESLKELAIGQIWKDLNVMKARSAKIIIPEDAFTVWRSTVGEWLKDYVNPVTNTIGHAFPVTTRTHTFVKIENPDVLSQCYLSVFDDFARILVRGAAILGPDKIVEMLNGWLTNGEILYQTSAVLNNLITSDAVVPLPGISIKPLPCSSDGEFGFLAGLTSYEISDLLGRSVLSIETVARPAFFRPSDEDNGPVVHAEFTTSLSIDQICQSLSLETGSKVDWAFQWNDYAEVSKFLDPEDRSTQKHGRRHLEAFGAGESFKIDFTTGVSTVSIDGKKIKNLSKDSIEQTLLAMERRMHDQSITVAILRWWKSVDSVATLSDRFIDLRVALEALYLKNFDLTNRGEMTFRLALYGAWHLGKTFEERKKIRKILRDAYSEASKAVHGGLLQYDEETQSLLAESQSLCREGILKLLKHDVKECWEDSILGTNLPQSE